jgi:hypothetical protein
MERQPRILREKILALYGEIDCRIEHGANSGGHLEYARAELSTILKDHA